MKPSSYPSFTAWYREGPFGPHLRTIKAAGSHLSLIEAQQPAGDVSDPATPDLVLLQDLGRSSLRADLGGGRFKASTEKGSFLLMAPNFANTFVMENTHHFRALSFPTAHWQNLLNGCLDRDVSFDFHKLHKGAFTSLKIRSALRRLWNLCDEEGVASRLLAQAAGYEVLAELFQMKGEPFAPAKGGLAPWAKRRCLEMMRERLSEDLSLEELANEVRLSPFHFARMFKESVGMSPRAYLVQLRIEKASELLTDSNLSVLEIAQEVGYSSGQVLGRAFMKYRCSTPVSYRRATRGSMLPLG